eukprot:scaffold4037_cov19-Tisochrysis_lutea.AAC.1
MNRSNREEWESEGPSPGRSRLGGPQASPRLSEMSPSQGWDGETLDHLSRVSWGGAQDLGNPHAQSDGLSSRDRGSWGGTPQQQQQQQHRLPQQPSLMAGAVRKGGTMRRMSQHVHKPPVKLVDCQVDCDARMQSYERVSFAIASVSMSTPAVHLL